MLVHDHKEKHGKVIHTARQIASFALLGAVTAGALATLPVAAAIPLAIDLHALGALIGGAAGVANTVFQARG